VLTPLPQATSAGRAGAVVCRAERQLWFPSAWPRAVRLAGLCLFTQRALVVSARLGIAPPPFAGARGLLAGEGVCLRSSFAARL
jgi:hypothetical protein